MAAQNPCEKIQKAHGFWRKSGKDWDRLAPKQARIAVKDPPKPPQKGHISLYAANAADPGSQAGSLRTGGVAWSDNSRVFVRVRPSVR
jgi:hypothetical protein